MKNCDICKNSQFNLAEYKSKSLCFSCEDEYRMIFDGSLISPVNPKVENLWFQKFKDGWESIEKESGLTPMDIPESIRAYYHRVWGLVSEDDTRGTQDCK